MQWFGRRESDNVDDERGGGGGRLAIGGGVLGLIAAAIYFFTGVDPSAVLNQVATNQPARQEQTANNGPEDAGKHFVRVVLADTEDI
ncbi:neutral zinc metallopeptidase, partial [Mucilaginibacter sp.]|uniref:neutral zinc metallopeptidase n=1 Tax=Mucilaginibacter sp. TaxID=1882438 RepID=UPI002ED14145